MPKLGMGPVRRNQLIEAAISSLHDYGYADTTVARIAKKAGVSSGIVHHYFDGKDLSLIHISEPTRRTIPSRMPSSA